MIETYYLVQTIDEWSNVVLYGLYHNLVNARKDIVQAYSTLKGIEDLELAVRAGTMGPNFDTECYDEETGEYVRVFGYVIRSKDPNGVFLQLEDR